MVSEWVAQCPNRCVSLITMHELISTGHVVEQILVKPFGFGHIRQVTYWECVKGS
jgi:hypothetical protein